MADGVQQFDGAIAVLDVGGVDLQADQMTFGVGDDVALAALDLLAGVVAARAAARARGFAPVIQHKHNEKDKPAFFAKTLYKARARIEQAFGRFKRVALRYEKTAANFRSIVSFAAGLCLIKFVHTA